MIILKSLQARVEPIICHKEDVGPKDNEERCTVQITCEYSRTNSDGRKDKKDSSFVKYMFCKALHIFKDKIGEPVEFCPKQNCISFANKSSMLWPPIGYGGKSIEDFTLYETMFV